MKQDLRMSGKEIINNVREADDIYYLLPYFYSDDIGYLLEVSIAYGDFEGL